MVGRGFDDCERALAAELFWQAFAGKLGALLAPGDSAVAFLARAMQPEFALSARSAHGPERRLLGLAGVKTGAGGLIGGGWRDLAAVYGWRGALWRGAALARFAREVPPDCLFVDGLVVAAEARGRGIGTVLLRALKAQARCEGRRFVQLEVAESNPRARALYEREGFVAVGEIRTGPLAPLLGFGLLTEMRCEV